MAAFFHLRSVLLGVSTPSSIIGINIEFYSLRKHSGFVIIDIYSFRNSEPPR